MIRNAAVGLFVLLLGATAQASLVQEPATLSSVLSLDGSGHVSVPHDPALNPTGAFTVEAWVRRDNDSACETIVSKGYQTAWWLGFCSGRIRFYGAGTGSYEDGTTSIPAHVWTHIAVVYRPGQRREYYINGELDYVSATNDPTPTTNSLPLYIGADPGGSAFGFDGKVASVRLWNLARGRDQIRRNLHVAMDEPLPGLVANWRLNGNTEDNIGGFHGTRQGSAGYISTSTLPAQPLSVDIDTDFNRLPQYRIGAATAYLPHLDQALLIGGNRGGSISAIIDRIDVATGAAITNIGTLPETVTQAAAAYVPDNDTVYTFGGTWSNSWGVGGVTKIFAIDPETGASREVAAALPVDTNAPAAVYHPRHRKVYIFGGRSSSGALDQVLIFDPETETLSPAAGTVLPSGFSHMGAAHASVDGRIYLFGGFGEAVVSTDVSDRIWQVALADDGSVDSISEMSRRLPGKDAVIRATEDPHTGLIYLHGGWSGYWLSVFDPDVGTAWRTRIALPDRRSGASLVVSPTNRHALIVGGTGLGDMREIWRFPVGDGPAIPIGDWSFPSPVASAVTDIDGSGRGVVVGTEGSGAYRMRADLALRNVYTASNLGSASGQVNGVRYHADNDHVWIATEDAGARLRGSQSTNYNSDILGTTQVLSVDLNPARTVATGAPFFGTGTRGVVWQRKQITATGFTWQWTRNFDGNRVASIAHREPADVWLLVNQQLRRLDAGETNYGYPCGLPLGSDLAFGTNRDWWIVGDGIEFGSGICRIPAAASPGSGTSFCPDLGCAVHTVDVDAEGRVWAAVGKDDTNSGGVVAYEITGASADVVRTTEFNWLNAPLGRPTPVFRSATERFWDSGVTAAGAVDEKIWMGNRDGRLATLAQRWRRLDEPNAIGYYNVNRVWLARGRAFLGGGTGLHVVSPDGVSWRSHWGRVINDVASDPAGRIWLATDDGVRLYQTAGLVSLSGREGVPPAGMTNAVAVDHDGRVWIGGDGGLTLFDRERFVLTFTAANSGLPSSKVTALFVDQGNRLWVGTDAGLARLDEGRFTLFTTSDGLPSDNVHAIEQLGSGELAVSTATPAGLALFDGTGFTGLALPEASGSPLPISVDDQGRLWADRAVRVNDQWRRHYSTNSGLSFNTVSHHAADKADQIWFAHGRSGGISVRGSHLPPLADVVPMVSGVAPTSGSAGTELVISGSGFGRHRTNVRVTIGAANAEVLSVSSGEIRVRITDTNTSGDVAVTVGGRRVVASDTFCAVPVISHFTPTGTNQGAEVVVFGTNFDRGARLRIGAGSERLVGAAPTEMRYRVRSDDASGVLRVRNTDAGCNQSGTSDVEFQHIGVTIDRLLLNQGHMSMGLAANKPTLIQNYLVTDKWLRAGEGFDDRVQIDEIVMRFLEPGEATRTFTLDNEDVPPTWPPPWPGSTPPGSILPLPPAWLQDIDLSLHATVTPWLQGGQPVEVQSILRYNGFEVGRVAETFDFGPPQNLNVLLVPIMRNDYTATHLDDMRRMVDGGLDNARQRVFHFGRVNFFWSPTVYRANDILWDFNEQVDVRDTFELFMASHNLERARRHWNGNSTNPSVTVAVGVVEAAANSNDGGGLAFWPDMSQLVNSLGLSSLDALCEFGDAVVEFFTLGLAGGDGCDIEVPLYVAWVQASSDPSRLIAHEVGHTLGLVRSHAANGSPTSNPSHSIFDEVGGDGTCGDLDEGSVYDRNRTLYRSPGFRGPAVNPLTSEIFRPRLDLDANHPRGKALMSYACQRGNSNVFVEPSDMSHLRFELDPLILERASPRLAGTARAEPIAVPGRRLLVTGMVNRADNTGELVRVEVIGAEGMLDVSYETGYALVQIDSEGAELARQGVFPVFRTSGEGRAGHELDEGFFATTIIAETGAVGVELRHDGAVLDRLEAGLSWPAVSLSSPSGGGSYASGEIPVQWTALDSDGDNLQISVHYSPDHGATWTAVGFAEGSGSLGIPVAVLAGSDQARIRVTASDGFYIGSATSDVFEVVGRPPLAYIGAPDDGAAYLEGNRIRLSGGAWDAGTTEFPAAGLTWFSDRDGELGTGPVIQRILSVGTHQIRLEATNSAGLSDSATIALTIRGDYDGDGVADENEPWIGLNPLWRHDAWFDDDNDGLPFLAELNWGTDPLDPDTSGSGRSDSEDIAEGLDPLDPTDTLPPDALEVTPSEIALWVDLETNTLLPHERIQVISRQAVDWTVSSNRSWLRTLSASGTTPDGVTIVGDADTLSSGLHKGTLTFSSELGDVAVPVRLMVEGSTLGSELPLFWDRFEMPPDG